MAFPWVGWPYMASRIKKDTRTEVASRLIFGQSIGHGTS